MFEKLRYVFILLRLVKCFSAFQRYCCFHVCHVLFWSDEQWWNRECCWNQHSNKETCQGPEKDKATCWNVGSSDIPCSTNAHHFKLPSPCELVLFGCISLATKKKKVFYEALLYIEFICILFILAFILMIVLGFMFKSMLLFMSCVMDSKVAF